MNVQIAADLDGRIAAIGPTPVHGARHDAHAYAASGLAQLLIGLHTMADLGYVGVDGIDLVPVKRRPGRDLHERQIVFNKDHSGIRAAVERAVAHFKCWRMFSEEGGRFRAPIEKFAETLTTTIGLLNFARSYEA
jgi:DDE superfamily endonuclease